MNKADRRRANEQQKQQNQQKQQKQKQKQKQKKQKQQKQQQQQQQQQEQQQQKQTGGVKTRASAQELKANATRPARQDFEGAAGGEEKGNATAALHQSVQARLPPIPARIPPTHKTSYRPLQTHQPHAPPLFQRCKWSSRKARPS